MELNGSERFDKFQQVGVESVSELFQGKIEETHV